MHRRTKQVLAGVGVAAALVSGETACSSNSHPKDTPETFHIKTSNPYGAKIERAAKRIIQIANATSTRYESKPPYSISFTLSTRQGGTIDYSVQTATPKHDPNQAELVEVQQTGPDEVNFDLSLYARDDGSWNMYCDTNPFAANGRSLAELGQKTIELNGRTVSKQVADANALLNDEIVNLSPLLDIATASGPASAAPNICAVNLG